MVSFVEDPKNSGFKVSLNNNKKYKLEKKKRQTQTGKRCLFLHEVKHCTN